MAEAKQSNLGFPDTPEFRAAVAAEVAKQLQTARQMAGSSAESAGDATWADQLALAIGTLHDQRPGAHRFVAPEILRSRQEARERMIKLLADARAQGKVPRYTLTAKVYLDEVLVDPMWIGVDRMQHQTEIEWPGVPNEAMRPLQGDDLAQAIYVEFRAAIGSKTEFLDERPQRLTAGGLVVHGAPRPTRDTGMRQSGEVNPTHEGLRVPHRGGEKLINILGTVAPPARQNAY